MNTYTKTTIIIAASIAMLVGLGLGAGLNVMQFLPFQWEQADANKSALHQQGAAPRLPDKLSFAGEKVPINDPEVRERLDKELILNTYRHGGTVLLLKRAAQWFPVMRPILKAEGVPEDFLYLCMAESDLNHVVSPAGAAGFWQFMKATAIQYGMVVNNEVDQRYDIELSTHAACKYIKNAYQKYGNWTMAAASYNMGMAGISRQMEKQRSEDYYDLFLNTETSRYVFRILAMKLIYEQPESYGFFLDEKDLYQPYKYAKAQVDGSVNSWIDFAEKHGINYKLLRKHNMWIRDPALRNTEKKVYTVKIIRQ